MNACRRVVILGFVEKLAMTSDTFMHIHAYVKKYVLCEVVVLCTSFIAYRSQAPLKKNV